MTQTFLPERPYTDQETDLHQAGAIAHADAQDVLIGDATVDGTAGNTVSARITSAQQAANDYTDAEYLLKLHYVSLVMTHYLYVLLH